MANKRKTYSKLSEDLNVDVAIVGGGLVGIDTAYLLSKSGFRVAVLEADRIGSGATSKTTAFLTQVIDTDYTDLISMFGEGKARLVWQSHGEAINSVQEIAKSESIDCDFKRCINYEFANDESQFKSLREEYKAIKKLGNNVRLRHDNALPFPNEGYLEFLSQAKYRAEDFLHGLAERAVSSGVHIYEKTKVEKISGKKIIKVGAGGHTVNASKVIIATYDPLGNPGPTRFKKGMYVSYVFEVQVPKGQIPEATYEDMDNPYHYFRIDPGEKFDTMIIGGEDHREELKMSPKKNYKALKDFIREKFPKMKYKIVSQWKGPILEPSDGLPLIGEYTENRYVACAFSGNGMTYSMIAAMLLRDLIDGKKNPWQKVYDPKRTPSVKQLAKKALDYGEELVGGAVKNVFK